MKLNIPGSIRIGPFDIKVRMLDEKLMESTGEYLPYFKEMHLDETRPEDVTQETFVHEVIEAINRHYEVGLEHKQITVLGMALSQVIRDLPGGE